MNLTITDDMTIKFISGGVEHVIDKLIFNQNNVDYTVYEKETEIDWSQEYLCFESLEDGNTIHFDCKYGVTPSFASWFAWSKDKTTWYVTNVTDGDDDISVSLDKGEKVYFKAELPNGGSWRNGDYGAGYDGLSRFYGDKKFNVMGNLMSMCYGDNFRNQTSLSSFGDNVFSHFFLGSAGDYDANPTTTMIDISNLYLPATTLTYNECYSGIFRSNAGLLYPPKSISVDDTQTVGLYGLFLNCTSLEESPILSWSTNGLYGVLEMFNNCSSLKRIAAIGSTSEDYWTANVPVSGIFYKNSNASWSSGEEGIPSGWTTRNWDASTIRVIDAELPAVYAGYVKGLTRLAQDGDSITLEYVPLNGYSFDGWYLNGSLVSSSNPYTFTVSGNATFEARCNAPAQQYLTIESLEDSNTITLTIGSSVTSSQMTSISYSTDGGTTWTTTNVNSTTQTINVNLNTGEKVLWKGIGSALANNYEINGAQYRSTFSSTKKYIVYGNIMSMLYGDSFSDKTSVIGTYAFCGLFYQSSKLLDAKDLIIPIKTVDKLRTFVGTFRGCTNMLNTPQFAPEAITQQHGCMRMFQDCTSITSTNDLSKLTTITGGSACMEMFRGCTSLVNVSGLPSTTLFEYCYNGMFKQCTALKKAPKLPAQTLANYCYREMFYGCSSLEEITCLATNISATNCLNNWVYNVASGGTFYKHPSMTSWTTGVNGIPSGWTTLTYEA